MTGNLVFAGSIASVEVATKMVLYYVHERGWSHVPWGWVTETLHGGRAGHGSKPGHGEKAGPDGAGLDRAGQAGAKEMPAAGPTPAAAPMSAVPGGYFPDSAISGAPPRPMPQQEGRAGQLGGPVEGDPGNCTRFPGRPAETEADAAGTYGAGAYQAGSDRRQAGGRP